METTELAPGYIVSRLTKGHWQLAARHGPATDRAEALDAMRRFVEAGITNFDCADHYLGTEEMIGAFRASHPPLAASLRVQTKLVPDRDMLAGLRRRDLEAIIDRSMARLGAERLDMVQFHWWDYESGDYAQAMGWLADMRREGKIELLGTTNFDCPSLRRILDSGVPVASNQLQYSLLDRRPEHGMVDLARERGVALQCYGTVAGGFLSRRWLGVPPPEEPFANRSLVKYRLIIEEFGGWALFQDADTAALHHRFVRDACGLPIVLYQAPVRAGAMPYPPARLAALASDPRVVAVKEGSWEVAAYEASRRAVRAVRPDVAMLGSGDEHLLASWMVGADGSQVSLAAIVPELVTALWDAAQAGEWAFARRLHDRVYPLALAIYGTAPGGRATTRLKACLHILGRLQDPTVRPPLLPLPAEEIARLTEALGAAC